MKLHLSRLSARIHAICILSALFLVPNIVQATDSNQPGIYLYGSDLGTEKLNYKFLRKNDNEYHFALGKVTKTGILLNNYVIERRWEIIVLKTISESCV